MKGDLILIGLVIYILYAVSSGIYRFFMNKINNYFDSKEKIKKLKVQLNKINWEVIDNQILVLDENYETTFKIIDEYSSEFENEIILKEKYFTQKFRPNFP